MSYIALTTADLILAALLIVLNGAISVMFRLGLERSFLIASVRMLIQLGLIGFVLKLVFAQTSPLWTALLAAVMIAVATYEITSRQSNRIAGPWSAGLGGVTLLVVGCLTTLYVTAAVIGSTPWYAPRVFLPILGMVLGNALTSVSLVLETLTQAAKTERAGIEARLALGHTRYQAFEGVCARALKMAMMPMLNAMTVAGIVTLPGMMSGQILSGVDPVEAAKYQVVVMFAIAGATALAALAAVMGGVWLLTDDRARLRLDRLVS